MRDEINIKYPIITDSLIKYLSEAYPNKLPETFKDAYELGRLSGQQDIINHLKQVKEWNENDGTEV